MFDTLQARLAPLDAATASKRAGLQRTKEAATAIGRRPAVTARIGDWRAWWPTSRGGRLLTAAGVLYLVLVHLVVGFALTQTDMSNRVLLKLGLVPKEEFSPDFMARMGRLIAIDRAAPGGSIVFLGDSHISRLDLSDLAYPAVNLSVPGETSARLLARMAHYRSLRDAKAIVLGVGLNDLMYRDAQAFALNIEQAIHLLPPATPLVVKGVMPVDETAQGLLQNDGVAAFNRVLRDACAARPRCLFVDVAPVLEDEGGNLAAERHVGDGLHLKDEAEALLREWMSAGIDEVLETVAAPRP